METQDMAWYKRRQDSDIKRRVARIAEDQVIEMHHRQRMSPYEIIHYYTGDRRPKAELRDAIEAVVRFNMDMIHNRGFAAF